MQLVPAVSPISSHSIANTLVSPPLKRLVHQPYFASVMVKAGDLCSNEAPSEIVRKASHLSTVCRRFPSLLIVRVHLQLGAGYQLDIRRSFRVLTTLTANGKFSCHVRLVQNAA